MHLPLVFYEPNLDWNAMHIHLEFLQQLIHPQAAKNLANNKQCVKRLLI